MKYEDARPLIETGDLIAVKSRKGFLPQLTRLIDGDDYTHTGVAIWIDKGLYMAEINSGHNHMVALSQYYLSDFDVFYPPVEDRAVLRDKIEENLRYKVDYGFFTLIVLAIHKLLRIKTLPKSSDSIVCSELSQNIYIDSGWTEDKRMITPGDLANKLKLKLSVGAE